MSAISIAVERLTRGLRWLLGLVLLGMIALNFVNVVCRYAFGFSLQGADEVQVYALIWLTFLGAALVTERKQHLRMDVVILALPSGFQRAARLLELVCFLIIGSFVTYQSYSYANRMFKLGYASDMAGVPTWIPHSAVSLGFGLMVLIAVWHAAQGASARRSRLGTTAPARSTDGPGE